MGVTTTKTNKPLNPRGNDQSPLAYNRAKLYSGKALDFDGVNDYLASGAFSLDTSEWSASMILKNDTAGSDQVFLTFAATGSNDESFIFYNNFGNSNKISFYGAAFTGSPVNFDYVIPTDYEHLTFTFASNTLSLYVNGVFVDSGSVTGNDGTQTASAIVGARKQASYGQYFDGQVSGVKMYSTALTAAQVADLYNNPEKVVPTGVDNTALKLWLPMMEGAGTTAYDGSGNGNHGTISGATYVNGVGAPVSQSAVMDWNKGSNLLPYSERFGQWTKNSTSVSDNVSSAPNGTTTADKWIIDSGIQTADIRQTISSSVGQNYLLYVFAKADEFSKFQLDTSNSQFSLVNVDFDLSTGSIVSSGGDNITEGIIDKGNGWYLCYMVGTAIAGSGAFIIRNDATQTGDGSKGMYLWGGGYVQASDITPYIPTIDATAQTTPVLLPQGLTSGRDITGVNLFENVRKQGALNLDGNSWAEVHDNASLDVTTAITLECWFYDTDEGAFEGVIGKWKDSTQRTYAIIKNNGSNNFLIRVSTDGSAQAGPTITNTDYGWIHLVMTYDGASIKGYKNGVYQSQAALTGSIATNDLPVEIGRYGQSTGSQYNNQIAQPRIYNRALTAEEVQRSYDSGKNIFTNS